MAASRWPVALALFGLRSNIATPIWAKAYFALPYVCYREKVQGNDSVLLGPQAGMVYCQRRLIPFLV